MNKKEIAEYRRDVLGPDLYYKVRISEQLGETLKVLKKIEKHLSTNK